jgi:hypothetical protein
MNDNVAIIVDFRVAGNGAGAVNAHLGLIVAVADKSARDSSRAFNQHFGANFFADLGARIVTSFKNSLSGIVSAAIDASQKAEAALRGLSATAINLGISPADAQAAVQNLQIVKDGLIGVGEASASLKNLLATGFGLPQAIDIIKAFGDTAAFGRQSALTYGEAIRSATEGIKNQNSILVDNAGLTKNLSVILRERGFVIQDINDENKKASALEALHTGLLKEASIQHGDANELLETYQGRMIQVEAAQTRFLKALGNTITQSTAVKSSLGAVVAVLDFLGQHTELVVGLTTAITALTIAVAIYNATAIAASIPMLASFVKGLKDVVFWMVHFRTALMETQTALAATGGWLALIGLAVTVGITLAKLTEANEELVDISSTRIDSIVKERGELEKQNARLGELTTQTELSAKQQTELTKQYKSLNIESQARVGNINDEVNASVKLKSEITNLIRLRTEELDLIARVTTAQLIGKVQELRQSEQRADELRKRIADLQAAEERLRNAGFGGGGLNDEEAKSLGVGRQEEIGRQGQQAQLHAANMQAQRDAVNLADANAKLRQEAGDLSDKQSALGGALRKTSDQLVDQSAKFGNVTGAVDHGKKLINDFRAEQELLTPTIQKNVSALDQLTSALDGVNDAVERQVGDRRKRINAIINTAAETAAQMGKGAQAGELAKGIVKFDITGQIARDIEVEKQYRTAREAAEKALGLNKERKTRKELTELEQLQRKINELRKDLTGFRDLTSKEFVLRFEQEGLERQIRDLNHILDLRRELGVAMNTPLPSALREALGRDDERAAQLARDYAEELQRAVDRKNAIKKLTDAQVDAEEELARATIALQIPVVSAFARAQTQYVQNIRERRNLEQDLTAEIAIEVRRRADAEQNAARDIQQTQAEAFRDRLRDEAKAREDLMRAVARSAIQQAADPNEAFRGNLLIGLGRDIAGGMSANPQVRAVEAGNKILAEIATNTSFLNPQKSPAPAADVTGGADAAGGGRDAQGISAGGYRRGIARLQSMNAEIQERIRRAPAEAAASERESKRTRAFEGQVKAVAGLFPDQMSTEQLIAATNEINRQTERRINLAQEAANIEIESRSANLALAKQQLIAEDELAERRESEVTGVVDLARATAELNRLRDPRSIAYRLELQRAEIDNVRELGAQERELIRLRDQARRGYLNDPRFVQRAQNNAEIARLHAAEGRAQRIVELEDQIAHAGEDAADRYRIAWLEAIREVQDADIRAVEEQIAAVVKLADATTLHTEQVRAQVAKHLAAQKTVSETAGEAIIKVYDKIAERMDATVDKAFSKLGFAGEIIGDFVKTAGRQLLNNIFASAIGLPDPATVAAGSGQVRAAQTQTMNVQAGTVIIAGGGGIGAGGGAGAGGAAGGGGALGGLLNLLGLGGGGGATGTPPFIQSGSFSIGGGASPFSGNLFGGSSPTTPTAQTGGGGILNRLFGQGSAARSFFGQNLGGGQFGGLFAKGSFGFGNSAFASALPMLGLSLGSSIGGGQGLGGILGGAGGALAAIGMISPGAVGLGAGSFLAPLFSNPITAIVGGALLVGAYFVGRSMARRRDETTRDQLTRDSRGSIQQLIKKVETDQMDGESALANAAQIRAQYLEQANALKDRKTREHAIATVRELDYDIANLQRAVDAQASRQALLQKMIPTFGDGGRYELPRGIPRGTQAAGYRYGLVGNKLTFGGVDEYVGMFREGEAFLTIENINALGGAPAMRRAGVRGFDGGGRTGRGAVAPPSRPASPAATGRPIMVVPVMVADNATADALVAASNEDVIAMKVVMHIQRNGQNGVAGAVATEIARR